MTDDSWVEQYRPTTWGGFQGNNKAVKELRKWIENFTPGDKARLLVGPPGVGKTTFAKLAADKYDIPLVQINASDARKSDDIYDIAETIESSPPGDEYYIVFLDEIDSQSSKTRKTPLYDALDSPNNPVILTANDEYSVPKALRNRVKTHEFKLQKRSRKAKLRDIAEEEELDITDDDLERLAERPGLRSAIYDLQMWAQQDIPPGKDEREWELSEFDVVDNILRGKKNSGNMSPNDLVMWLDENLSREFRGVEAVVAYDTLARADKWLQRGWDGNKRWWKYTAELAEQTATQRLTEPYDGWLDKDFPEWFRHSMPRPTADTPEAKLYRKLKGYDDPTFRFGGSFLYFRKTLLPILRDLSVEERLQLAKHHDLETDEIKALDLTKTQYKKWANQEVPDERQKDEEDLLGNDALSW